MAASAQAKISSALDELSNSNSFLDASEILLKFANNILNNVDNEKFRRLRLSNEKIQSKLLTVPGGMECLFEMGFEEDSDGEYLCYPKAKSLDRLSEFRDQLQGIREKKRQTPSEENGADFPSLPPPPVRDQANDKIGPQRVDLASKMNMLISEQAFFHKLQSNLMHVLIYEESALQKKARDLIPLQKFLATSSQKALEAKSNVTNGEKPLDMRDFLLLELLNWFKTSFFKWVDNPECSVCAGRTERRGMVEPTSEESRFGAGRVEGYYCAQCAREERFPRYNHPGKLLETRRGRCGEWANCFTLCCRALGLEARYVLDWTDHVWTEVYSQSQCRWLHCDPCENVCDKPLLYEAGWGKKLTYVIAFAKDDIKDVTWRYTADVGAILKRRKECREDWLVDTIVRLRNRKQARLSEIRRTELLNRALTEFSELLKPRQIHGDESGRTTGSLAWRLSRGETGQRKTFVIRPRPADVDNGRMSIRYYCARNEYVYSGGETVAGWETVVNRSENVVRKEELDWKMVYLTVRPGELSATLSWKFDLSECGDVTIDRVAVLCESRTFHQGRVQWRLCGKMTCVLVTPGIRLETGDLSGETEVTLTAELTSGEGDQGWQHAQLFRQATNDTDQCSLEIGLTFKSL